MRGLRRLRHPSIRFALLLALGSSLLPALGIILWTALELNAHIARNEREQALRQVESFAGIQQRVTESTRQFLSALSLLPGFKNADYPYIKEILTGVLADSPDYLNLTLVDTRGIVAASSRLAEGIDVHDRFHVAAALEHGRFTVGDYILNLIDARPTLAYSQPVFDHAGRLNGAIIATITLDNYAFLFRQLRLPDQAILGLVDRNGTRLFHYPPKDTNPVGESIQGDSWQAMLSGDDTGLLDQKGSDGVARIYAYKKLRLQQTEAPYMYVVYALPTSAVYRTSRNILIRNLLVMAAVALIAFWLLMAIADRTFGRKLKRILATATRIQDGDLAARVDLADRVSDLGRIGYALDRMTATVEERDRERADNTRTLQANLTEKETLLKEIHHRVKNNLQMVLSLLNLQEDESDTVAHFKKAMDARVQAMALIHEMLYESDRLSVVDLGAYARRLLGTLSTSANPGVTVDVAADDIRCSLDKAIPIGLILSELGTNAFKHAFAGRTGGRLTVGIASDGNTVNVTVADDGPGLPASFSGPGHGGLGLHLVQALSSQLAGDLSWRTGPGTTFTVRFPCPPEPTAAG